MLDQYLSGQTIQQIAKFHSKSPDWIKTKLSQFWEYTDEVHRRRLNNPNLYKDRQTTPNSY